MKRRWYPAVAAGLFAADQAVKTGVSQNMDKGAEKKLAGKAVLRRVENRGLCLGLLSGSPAVVRGLSAAASGIVTVLFGAALAGRKGACRKAGYTMMAAGAWSNTFDRFARGHVVDYIGFRAGAQKFAKITYNLGDFFIVAGALLAALGSLWSGKSDG